MQERQEFEAINGHEVLHSLEQSSEPSGEAKSVSDLAAHYNVTERSVQKWIRTVILAYSWIPHSDLVEGVSAQTRYTVRCQELLAEFRQSGLNATEWTRQVNTSQSFEQASEAPLISEVEVVEETVPITTTPLFQEAQPILQVNIEHLHIELPEADTATIDGSTSDLSANTAALAGSLAAYVTADLKAQVGAVLAQNRNLAAAVQNRAVTQTVTDLRVGKPPKNEAELS